jgi:hypothetical protein
VKLDETPSPSILNIPILNAATTGVAEKLSHFAVRTGCVLAMYGSFTLHQYRLSNAIVVHGDERSFETSALQGVGDTIQDVAIVRNFLWGRLNFN